MQFKFLHYKVDALTGRKTRYVHRHPVIEIQCGLYEALKPVAKARGYRTVNQMIAAETSGMLMKLLLESE